MAIVWTKYWGPSDDGTVLKGIDLRNIQDDINTTGLADADAIQGFPVAAPTPSDDGKGLVYDDAGAEFIYANFSGLPAGLGPLPWPTDTAPAGWLLCYGQAVSRTTYASLFAVIGITFGIGDNLTTFNVPDMRGRIPFGKDNMGGVSANRITDVAADTIGGTLGEETHLLTAAESGVPVHTHLVPGKISGTNGSSANFLRSDTQTDDGDIASEQNASASAASAHNNLQPGITLNYIIKI